jgi:hypothetical protein
MAGCPQVAHTLTEPLGRILVGMVLRAFYHYSRAVERGEDGPSGVRPSQVHVLD